MNHRSHAAPRTSAAARYSHRGLRRRLAALQAGLHAALRALRAPNPKR